MKYIITFSNDLRTEIEVNDGEVEVLRAVNGWGNPVPAENIKVEKIKSPGCMDTSLPGYMDISLLAHKGSVADALRELATYIEEWDSDENTEYPTQYESDTCVAEIKEA